eukprot:CCRYP_003213-RA/>CCRYP_003213-RA protein AED:0.16 eAED:-0.04 QI:0/-1/0/1/-1/1/1/0/131
MLAPELPPRTGQTHDQQRPLKKESKFCTFDIANFYLGTPLDHPEFIRIRLDNIPEEFIDKNDLTHHVSDGWIYFKIVKGVYGLQQSSILANQLLKKRLNEAGYYQLDFIQGFMLSVKQISTVPHFAYGIDA